MAKKAVLVVFLTGTLVLVGAQQSPRSRTGHGSVPDKALMQQIWDAWATMDPGNAAKYYDKQPDDVFFDIAPLKYDGWDNYAKGAGEMIHQSFSGLKFTVNDDARVQHSPSGALGTATVAAVLTSKDGKTQNITFRWTVVWANKNGNWLIIHEHASAPLKE